MTLSALLTLTPLLGAAVVYVLPDDRPRRLGFLLTSLAHTGLAALTWSNPDATAATASRLYIGIDPLGRVVVSVISLIFLVNAIYTIGYMRRETRVARRDFQEEFLFVNAREKVFLASMLMFLATMTLVTVSMHLGLLWVAMEATTFASAPLIYFHRHHRSLEATWKYLLLCSVGIAIALLGNFALAAAATPSGGGHHAIPLLVPDLIAAAAEGKLNPFWLKLAFLFYLVGYGTKVGLAPMHNWKPDAYSESPSSVASLLSGALANCGLMGILRAQQVCVAAGLSDFTRGPLVAFGLLSLLVAAVFVVNQQDYRRMLAYSSIEHMGILTLGVGVGGLAAYGAVFHLVNHSLVKAAMFLTAGNAVACYHTRSPSGVRGMMKALPWTGAMWFLGFLAIIGSPPFGTFFSELLILRGTIERGEWVVGAAYVFLLTVVFVGLANLILPMTQGAPPTLSPALRRERVWQILPPATLLTLAILLGVHLPAALSEAMRAAAGSLGGTGW